MKRYTRTPVPTESSLTYWECANNDQLRIPQCRSCGEWVFFPCARCQECSSSDFEWEEVQGDGRIVSYAVQHTNLHPAYHEGLPYILTVVRLEEGPQMMGNLIGCEADDVFIESEVKVVFEERKNQSIPQFELV